MGKRIAILLLFLCGCWPAVEARWQRPIVNYARQMYAAGSQNWAIEQHDNGWIYVANNKGLLEYDGVRWSTYPIRNAKTRAVKKGNDGRIYIGGLGQFGYFVPNSLGELDYVCLSDSLNQREVGNIWHIHVSRDRVYFQSDHAVFYLENDRIHRVPCRDITYSALIDDQLYIAAKGLFLLNGDSVVRLAGTEGLVDNVSRRVVGLYAYEGKLLIVSNRAELFDYSDGVVTPWPVVEEGLRGRHLHCSAFDGRQLALGSMQEGIWILRLHSGEVEHISTRNGLQNESVLSLAFDCDGNLWAGLDNGIDCILFSSPVGPGCVGIGSGYASVFYRDKLYLGTNQGVFTGDSPFPLSDDSRVVAVCSTIGQVFSLVVCKDELFCGGTMGLWVLSGERAYTVPDIRGVWRVMAFADSDKMLAATYQGLRILQKRNGRWEAGEMVKDGRFSAKVLCREPQTDALWMANKEGGIHRVLLNAERDSVVWHKCYNSSALPQGNNVYISPIDGKLVVASRQGLFCYNSSKDTLEHYDELEQLMGGRTVYTYLRQDADRNIWYVSGGALKLLRYDPLAHCYYRNLDEVYLKDWLIEDFEHVDNLADDRMIIGTEEGFSLLDLPQIRKNKTLLNLQIRRVYLKGLQDSLVYGRSFLPNDSRLKIPYKHNSIRIEYGVNNYDKSVPAFYSCRLDGPVSEPWSRLAEETRKEYTLLPEGKYTFYVRTGTGGEEMLTTSFSFEVLPPWYRTWWSYLLYLTLACAFFYWLYRKQLAVRRHLLMQQELEFLRQKEALEQENSLKDKQIDSLKEENLQAELHHKSEELALTTLNIVRKNEMLLEIKKEVLGISHSISEENLVSLRRKTLRLLSQIDTNIEHDEDLQAFQNNFDAVHHDFFHRLEEAYPELSHKDKMLCAYIKMNLLSKEIAPLMNISLRGVEISRYRLRKKLGLEEGGNLSEFLQKFGK
ncbi:MAG: transcriptional regulator [Bacteroides sp.]|nr:transcriptional regulator [Bacteroides sp.]